MVYEIKDEVETLVHSWGSEDIHGMHKMLRSSPLKGSVSRPGKWCLEPALQIGIELHSCNSWRTVFMEQIDASIYVFDSMDKKHVVLSDRIAFVDAQVLHAAEELEKGLEERSLACRHFKVYTPCSTLTLGLNPWKNETKSLRR